MKLMPIEQVNVIEFKVATTRRERLVRWANLVRCSKSYLHLYHGFEYMEPQNLRSFCPIGAPISAFTIAIEDPVFQAEHIGYTMGEVMDFFSLSQRQLHEFSCDCGGDIDKTEMANRIEQLAR